MTLRQIEKTLRRKVQRGTQAARWKRQEACFGLIPSAEMLMMPATMNPRIFIWLLALLLATAAVHPAPASEQELVLIRVQYTVMTQDETQRNDWNAKDFAHVLENVSGLLNETTSVQVSPDPKVLKLTDEALFSHPFLFMAGHHGLVLSETEVDRLRTHLTKGGFLLATACCGSPSFANSFEREMKKVFPSHKLAVIRPEHLVYRSLYKLTTIHCLSGASGTDSSFDFDPMPLKGIEIDGRLAVVFCPPALTCGWATSGTCIASCRRVAPDDARKLAANIVVYALTH